MAESAHDRGPDYSAIDSLAKAHESVRSGGLERLFLMPKELGGKDVPQNIVYVPRWVTIEKARIDDIVIQLVAEGSTIRYSARAQYRGASFVPAAIAIATVGPGSLSGMIEIWGHGRAR
jgi:hypothetical protein